MALIYNKIVESDVEPSPMDLWLKDGKLKHYKGGWKDISGGTSEENNIVGLGTAAYMSVEEIVELVKQSLNS